MIAALLTFAAVAGLPSLSAPGYDLAPLSAAGRLVATGRQSHLYDHDPHHYNRTNSPAFDAAVREVGFELGSTPFVYPPLVAGAMQPLSELPFPALMRWWTLSSAILLVTGLWLTFKLYLPHALGAPTFALALFAISLFEPVRYGLWLGQTTALIFVLVMIALVFQRRGQLAVAGLSLAIAAFVKLTPAVLALIWLWRGPRRAFAWFAGSSTVLWVASIGIMGLDLHLDYVSRIRQIGSSVLVAYNNHSLIASLSRRHVDEESVRYWQQHAQVASDQVLLGLFVAVIGAMTLVLIARIPVECDERWRPMAEGLGLAGILLVPSISWTHYFVLLLPIIAICIARIATTAGPAAYVVPLALFLLCSPPLMPDQVHFALSGHHLVAGPTLAALIATAMLLWLLFVAGRRTTVPARRGERTSSPSFFGSTPEREVRQ